LGSVDRGGVLRVRKEVCLERFVNGEEAGVAGFIAGGVNCLPCGFSYSHRRS
jgi:hypothetical protein